MNNYELQARLIQCLESALFNQKPDANKALVAWDNGNYRIIEVNDPVSYTGYHWSADVLVFVVYSGENHD